MDQTSATDSVDLTVSADRVDGLDVEAAGINQGENLVITDLASNLAVDLADIDDDGNFTAATADFDADGTFTGDLGTVTVTIADDVTMTAAASVLAGADINRSSVVGSGSVAATMSSTVPADSTVDLTTLADGSVVPAIVDSITVLDSMTFAGTFHAAVPTEVADGATLSVAADTIDGSVVNAAGTTGAVAVDASAATQQTDLLGTADYTVTDMGAQDLDASMVSGDLDATVTADALSIALGGGSNVIDAEALADTEEVTLTGAVAADAAEETALTFAGTWEVDDVIVVTIDGTRYEHTVVSTAEADIAAAFDTLINGIDASVTSGAAGAVLTLTAINAGEEVLIGAETDSTAGTVTPAETDHEIATGNATVSLTEGDLAAGAVVSDLIVTASADGATNEVITGSGDDEIATGSGADIIDAGAGDDIIDGGTGADDMNGGLGEDVFIVDSFEDVVAGEVIDGGSSGQLDTLQIDATDGVVDLTLIGSDLSNVEQLDLNEAGNDVDVALTAEQRADLLFVSADAGDQLFISALTGVAGDPIAATDAEDTFEFLSTDTGVSITSFASGTGGDVLDFTDLFGSSATSGNTASNTLANNADQVGADSVIYFNTATSIDGKDYGAADFADIFSDAGGTVFDTGATGSDYGTGAQFAFIMTDNNDSADAQLYFVDTTADATAGDITAADVTLIGTIESVDSTTTFVDGNFA
jgi:hypothetical protein